MFSLATRSIHDLFSLDLSDEEKSKYPKEEQASQNDEHAAHEATKLLRSNGYLHDVDENVS
jgi:hypothetical protein